MSKDDKCNVIVPRKRKYAIEFAVRNDGSIPGNDFYDTLLPRDKAYLLNLFSHIAENGEESIQNEARFKHETGPIYAFKRKAYKPQGGKGQIRLPCFRLNDRWIITHGFWKPARSKWPRTEISIALEIMNEVIRRENR